MEATSNVRPTSSAVAHRGELPATPSSVREIPRRIRPKLARLVLYFSRDNRPLFGALVPCSRCHAFHRVPWRYDWGLSPDVASLQVIRCPKGPRSRWIVLDPARVAEHEKLRADSVPAFQEWQALRLARKAPVAVPEAPQPSPPVPAALVAPPVAPIRRGPLAGRLRSPK